jgi:hypothetical protein
MGTKDKQKDQEMAQRMKAAGEERRSGRCPICYNMIPNGLFEAQGNYIHLTARCPGPRRKGGMDRFRT